LLAAGAGADLTLSLGVEPLCCALRSHRPKYLRGSRSCCTLVTFRLVNGCARGERSDSKQEIPLGHRQLRAVHPHLNRVRIDANLRRRVVALEVLLADGPPVAHGHHRPLEAVALDALYPLALPARRTSALGQRPAEGSELRGCETGTSRKSDRRASLNVPGSISDTRQASGRFSSPPLPFGGKGLGMSGEELASPAEFAETARPTPSPPTPLPQRGEGRKRPLTPNPSPQRTQRG
jgi:hypothetical protein